MRRLLLLATALALPACFQASSVGSAVHPSGSASSSGSTGSGSTSGSSGSGGAVCSACVSDSDCANSGQCVQLGADSYCLANCAQAPCESGTCQQVTDFAGEPEQVCVPASGSCANDTSCPGGCPAGTTCDVGTRTCVGGSGSGGSSGTSASQTCGTLVGPDVSAGCTCASGHTCSANNCYGGWWCDTSTNKCVAPPTSCGGGSSGSTGTTSGTCDGLLSPSTPTSACTCPSYATDCQANGCYGGWWCDPLAGRCHAPPSGCGGSTTTTTTGSSGSTSTGGTTGSGSTSGSTGTTTGGTTTGGSTGTSTGWTGSVSVQGGSVNRLFFAAVGDARPPNLDDTAGYPTAIITKIYQDIAATNPEFVVSTGDYMFASPSGSQGAPQLALYMQARQAYSGVVFAAMGNHECTGYTASNCLTTSSSNNYAAFMQQLITPLGQTRPYYRYDVNDSAGQWTAKFIVLAMNSWDSTQGTWLQQQLQQPTTYTFIIRHEPDSANTAPGVTPSDSIIGQYPYTLKIVGHTHEFAKYSTREVIVGNGGAPITGSSNYGYAVIQQTATGDLQVSNYDYSSNTPVTSYIVPK